MSRNLHSLVLLALVQTVSVVAQPYASAVNPILEVGKSIERDLAGGQAHTYAIRMLEGQFARVVIGQRGVDVLVRVQETGGKNKLEFDSELRVDKPETVEFVVGAAGTYNLEVEAKFKALPPGKYVITLIEQRPAAERDVLVQTSRRISAESIQLRASGKYAEAQTLAERVVAIRDRELGQNHPDTAAALQNLARLFEDQGNYDHAERLAERALHIRESVLGADHPDVGLSLNNLAAVYWRKEELGKSISLNQRAVAILERSLGPKHPATAICLINLGVAYKLKGDLVRAEEVYRRAISIQETVLSAEHRNVAVVSNNLGLVYIDKGDYDAAEPLFRRAVAIFEKTAGPEHPSLSDPLMNLAKAYSMRGRYADAEGFYERALALVEKAFGPSHPNRATVLFNWASCLRYKGDNIRAEALYKRALEIREAALGIEHPSVARILDSMAILSESSGDVPQALQAQQRSARITERQLGLNLIAGSERQRLAYLALLPEQTGQIISTSLRFGAANPEVAELAATVLLQRKGRVQDAVGDTLSALRRRANAEDRRLLDELHETTAEIARLVVGGDPGRSLVEDQKQIRTLEDRRQKLEETLSSHSAVFILNSRSVTLAAIQAALPPGAALVEFAVYQPVDLNASLYDERLGPARYAALLVQREGTVKWWDLGAAQEIDTAVAELRRALRDPKRRDSTDLARAVDKKVMQPIRASLGNVSLLLISPDGLLNLLPYAALVDENGNYLVERYSLAYLTTGRDLLRLATRSANPPGTRPVILADPAFGDPEVSQSPGATSTRARSRANVARRSVTTGPDLSSVYFAPLGGTSQEAQAIRALFPESLLLTGAKAAKAALRNAASPRILHIATHGFFLDDANSSAADSKPVERRSLVLSAEIENPMLRSGLALAGANLRSDPRGNGILTALEASGLDLWGTKLVTLSACDTGLGEVRNGEGVYGFRRALTLAGAETLVMSLWPVSDHVTRELMTAYYTRLKLGEGRGEALRQVQLKMLHRKDRQHPFYWASFIQLGEWANLDGKR